MMEKRVTPRSVAIIMDGNGRWANARGLERFEGHIEGVESVRSAVESAMRHGVECLTIYAFSTENWGRPTTEVDSLMELMARSIMVEVPELARQGVRVRFIGDRARFSQEMQGIFAKAEGEPIESKRMTMQIALNYSSRDELRRAISSIAEAVKCGEIEVEQIDEELISSHLDTLPGLDPDLIIRTSGEQRLSNFMMWQASYSELYFTDVLWPDFRAAEFDKAIESYMNRDRRFGLVKGDEDGERRERREQRGQRGVKKE